MVWQTGIRTNTENIHKGTEMKKPDELRLHYQRVFSTDQGKAVLDDLERIANQLRVSADNPNPYACVYKVAQQSLLKRIYNMLNVETQSQLQNLLKGTENGTK